MNRALPPDTPPHSPVAVSMATTGECAFLHPASWLLGWVLLVLAAQHWHGALLLAGAVLCLWRVQPPIRQAAWQLLRRSRWLLLSLWLILAYGAPGEAWQGFVIAPSLQGMAEASQHALRLVFLLVTLATVLHTLSRQQLVSGLFALLHPLQRFGLGAGNKRLRLDAERSVVRLALVLLHLEHTPRGKGWWQRWQQVLQGTDTLSAPPIPDTGTPSIPDALEITLPRWQRQDLLVLAGLLLLWLLCLFNPFGFPLLLP